MSLLSCPQPVSLYVGFPTVGSSFPHHVQHRYVIESFPNQRLCSRISAISVSVFSQCGLFDNASSFYKIRGAKTFGGVERRAREGGEIGRSRMYAQVQGSFDGDGLAVTDLRNLPEASSPPMMEETRDPLPLGDAAKLSERAGIESVSPSALSEEEARQALLFEQGTSARDSSKKSFEGAGPSVEEAKQAAGLYKRTITIPLKKGKGRVIADMLMIYGGLLDRPFGSGTMIAAAGGAVVERVQLEVEKLRGQDSVDEQLLFEVVRLIRLLEMDLKLVSAAQKEATLLERLEQAKKHCRQAVVLSNSI